MKKIQETMKMVLILLLIAFLGFGCGLTEQVTDGLDGSDGAQGPEGRKAITPCARPFTWDVNHEIVNFQDVDDSQIILSQLWLNPIDMSENKLLIRVPINSSGNVIRANINGVSGEITVPDDAVYNLNFMTGTGTDTATTVYLDTIALDNADQDNYFAYYIGNIQQEFYFTDTFE